MGFIHREPKAPRLYKSRRDRTEEPKKNAKRGRPFSWTFGVLCLLSSTFDVQANGVLRSLVPAKLNCQSTYQLRSFLHREPVATGRNANLTFNRSTHHAYALDDTHLILWRFSAKSLHFSVV